MNSHSKKSKLSQLLQRFDQLGIVLVLIVLMVAVGFKNSTFYSWDNIINVLRSTSFIFIIGIAITYVLITGGLDLSVGSVMAMAGILSAMTAQAGAPLLVSILCGILFGFVIGLINGILVVRMNIPALIVTLGMMYVVDGLVLIVTKGSPIYPLPDSFTALGQGSILGVPNIVLIALVLALIGAFVLHNTQYGRCVYAIGGNRETARLAGIHVNAIQMSVYVLASVSASLGGILMAGRLNSAQPSAGSGYELTVVAAVIIGGTSMFGGSGSIFGTLLGALLMTVIENALLLMKISAYWQSLIVGIIIIFAVGLDQYRRKKYGMG